MFSGTISSLNCGLTQTLGLNLHSVAWDVQQMTSTPAPAFNWREVKAVDSDSKSEDQPSVSARRHPSAQAECLFRFGR